MALPYVTFHVGSVVEVAATEEGMLGAFHTATGIEELTHFGFYRVRFDTLLTDDGQNFLEKLVLIGNFRPPPPTSPVQVTYRAGDHVDLWNREGWWYGIVQRRRSCGDIIINFKMLGYNNHYVVHPEHFMRPHVHWTGRSWYRVPRGIIQID